MTETVKDSEPWAFEMLLTKGKLGDREEKQSRKKYSFVICYVPVSLVISADSIPILMDIVFAHFMDQETEAWLN